jgi:hypothetical protein
MFARQWSLGTLQMSLEDGDDQAVRKLAGLRQCKYTPTITINARENLLMRFRDRFTTGEVPATDIDKIRIFCEDSPERYAIRSVPRRRERCSHTIDVCTIFLVNTHRGFPIWPSFSSERSPIPVGFPPAGSLLFLTTTELIGNPFFIGNGR